MRKLIIVLLFTALIFPVNGKSQSPDMLNFINFVSKNYQYPNELKYDCNWKYAIVKVKTDRYNKIIKYDVLNDLPQSMRKEFGILIGYQFSKDFKINGHPIVFYLLVDNSEICKPKATDTIYPPNQIFNIMISHFDKIQKADPKTIIISTPIYKVFYPSQHKSN